MNRIIQHAQTHHSKYVFGAGILGANVGGYLFARDSPKKEMIPSYLLGSIIGFAGGVWFTIMSPILVPGAIVGVPGYLLSTHHSSQRESRQKEGTQADLTCPWSKKMEELRALPPL